MEAELEPGLTYTDVQLSCIAAIFSRDTFSDAEDDRGKASSFARIDMPVEFIEVIHTLPNKIRGNHVHHSTEETLSVLSGKLALYVLCDCPDQHVFVKTMSSGDTVLLPKGTPHTLHALQETDAIALFDKDPRSDRDRVHVLKF